MERSVLQAFQPGGSIQVVDLPFYPLASQVSFLLWLPITIGSGGRSFQHAGVAGQGASMASLASVMEVIRWHHNIPRDFSSPCQGGKQDGELRWKATLGRHSELLTHLDIAFHYWFLFNQ